MPGRPPVEVTAFHAELLRRCDGTRAVRELVDCFGGRYGAAEVDAGLEELESRRWIVRRLEVPSSAHPEQHLRAALERIGDPEVRGSGRWTDCTCWNGPATGYGTPATTPTRCRTP